MEVLADRLSYEQQEIVHEALAKTTTAHIETNGSLFKKLDFDPIANPSQDLRNVHLPAVPTSPDEVDELTTIANSRLYPYIRDNLFKQGALIGEIRKMRSGPGKNSHLGIVATHQTMPDIAVIDVAFSIAEHGLYGTDWPEIILNNGLTISRGVATLHALGLAASEVIQKTGHVFMSFPRTKTMNTLAEDLKLELPSKMTLSDVIDDNNTRMRKHQKQWLTVGAAAIGDVVTMRPQFSQAKKRSFTAWSGSTDKVKGDPFSPDSVVLERAYDGVIGHLKYGFVLPTVVWDRGDNKEPIFITGEITTVKKPDDIDRIQEWQRSTLAKALGLSDDKIAVVNSKK